MTRYDALQKVPSANGSKRSRRVKSITRGRKIVFGRTTMLCCLRWSQRRWRTGHQLDARCVRSSTPEADLLRQGGGCSLQLHETYHLHTNDRARCHTPLATAKFVHRNEQIKTVKFEGDNSRSRVSNAEVIALTLWRYVLNKSFPEDTTLCT
jgi:hypothetical protein